MKTKYIIPVIILIVIIPLSVILYPIIKNNNYKKQLLDIIYKNTKYKDIVYINKDNNYYIIKTKKEVAVLDLNFEEKLSMDIKELSNNNLELVYRRNNLYYEEKIKEEEKIIYNFYDIYTNELSYSTTLGGV